MDDEQPSRRGPLLVFLLAFRFSRSLFFDCPALYLLFPLFDQLVAFLKTGSIGKVGPWGLGYTEVLARVQCYFG